MNTHVCTNNYLQIKDETKQTPKNDISRAGNTTMTPTTEEVFKIVVKILAKLIPIKRSSNLTADHFQIFKMIAHTI